MPKEKTITRAITTGYSYDVMERQGDTMKKVAEVITPAVIRSIKQQSEVLIKNNLSAGHVLVLNQMLVKQYTMNEADFIKYATEVTDITDGSGTSETA